MISSEIKVNSTAKYLFKEIVLSAEAYYEIQDKLIDYDKMKTAKMVLYTYKNEYLYYGEDALVKDIVTAKNKAIDLERAVAYLRSEIERLTKPRWVRRKK